VDTAPADSGNTIKVVAGVNIPMIIEALGGKDNIVTLDNCATRLRVDLKDASIVDDAVFKPAGAKGVMKAGKTGVQVIIGLKVQSVADAAREYLKNQK
jgi:PTS system N-acetylglucosamine-specific IIC component